MTHAKILFDRFIADLKLEESPDEITALAFAVLNYFGVSNTDVISNKIVPLGFGTLSPIISRLNAHEPLQYILNEAWFYGRKFFVDPSVLIPRPETELLVEESIKYLESFRNCQPRLRGQGGRILDIGTGSGCIAISLALKFPNAHVTGIDISDKALTVAKRNATELKANVQFEQIDILKESNVMGKFNLIVSNPPYISTLEKPSMAKNVVDYEPHLALFAPEKDPLIFYRAIAKASKALLTPNGVVLVEINEKLGDEVKAIFNAEGNPTSKLMQDLTGKVRFVLTHF